MARRYLGMTWHQYDRAQTAHHEGGHAIVALVTKRPFRIVTLRPDGPFKGSIFYAGMWMDPKVKVLSTLAGPRANQKFAPRSRWLSRNDWEAAADILHIGIKGKDLDVLMDELDKRAAALVEKHWFNICKVAEALLKHGELSENEVRALIGWPARTPAWEVEWE